MLKWYSLFSHTGRETEAVWHACHNLVSLETAITNNMDYDGPLPCIKLCSGKLINEWLMEPGNIEPESIITLNGYMRILPAEVLSYLKSIQCKVYNIHPAPINVYPDLKGKDPQNRLFEGIKSGKYDYQGAVIHKVDAGVDTGEIIYWRMQFPKAVLTLDDVYNDLHALGTAMWIEFFEEEMYQDGSDT